LSIIGYVQAPGERGIEGEMVEETGGILTCRLPGNVVAKSNIHLV